MSSISTNYRGVEAAAAAEIYDRSLQLRRRISGELDSIGRELSNSSLNDTLTSSLRSWHQSFETESKRRGANLEEVFQRFVQTLGTLLVDSITELPLDDEPFLGTTDGEVYGKHSLLLHLYHVDPSLKNRSPLNPEDERPFFVEPHLPARFMVTWIKQFVEEFSPSHLIMAVRELPYLPEIPVQERVSTALRALLERRRALQRNVSTSSHDRLQNIVNRARESTIENEIPDDLVTGRARLIEADFLQGIAERMQRLAAQNAAFEVSTNSQINALERAHAEDIERLRAEIGVVESTISDLQEEIRSLNNQLTHLGESIEEAKAANILLRISINQLIIENEKLRRQRRRNKIIKGVFTVIKIVAMVYLGAPTTDCGFGGSQGYQLKVKLPT